MRSAPPILVNVTSQAGAEAPPRRQALINWLALLALLALCFI